VKSGMSELKQALEALEAALKRAAA